MIVGVTWKLPHQCISKLTPITGGATNAHGDNIKMITIIIATTRIAFSRPCLLQFNLRAGTITYGLYFNSHGLSSKRYNCKIMHAVGIVALKTFQPAFSAGDTKFPFEMDLCNSSF